MRGAAARRCGSRAPIPNSKFYSIRGNAVSPIGRKYAAVRTGRTMVKLRRRSREGSDRCSRWLKPSNDRQQQAEEGGYIGMRSRTFSVIGAMAGTGAILMAQTGRRFEVASVRRGLIPSDGHWTVSLRITPTGVEATYVTLRQCILRAYDIGDYQLDGPGWLDDNRFSIEAKVGTASTADGVREQLAALLVERFKLNIVHTRKQISAYVLRPTSQGVKLRASSGESEETGLHPTASGVLIAKHVSMPELCEFLSHSLVKLDRPVLDRTNLSGRYDFDLRYSEHGVRGDSEGSPIVFESVKQQLGLKLQAGRVYIDALVVKGGQRTPVEN
jgi:uncharacterized protein (TIGR03435 family)